MIGTYLDSDDSIFLLSEPISDISEIEISKFPNEREVNIYAPISFDMQSIFVNRVDEFADMPNSHWHMSGYLKPSEITFEKIVAFITLLPNYFLCYLNQENVIPSTYGTFVLDFERLNKKISIEISGKKIGVIKEFPGERDFVKDYEFDGRNIPEQIISIFENFVA